MEISRWYAEQYNASVCLVKKKQDLATYYYELHTIMPTAKNLPAATGPHLPGNLGGGAGEWATTLSLQNTCHPDFENCKFVYAGITRDPRRG
jgi:hypothetical protein